VFGGRGRVERDTDSFLAWWERALGRPVDRVERIPTPRRARACCRVILEPGRTVFAKVYPAAEENLYARERDALRALALTRRVPGVVAADDAARLLVLEDCAAEPVEWSRVAVPELVELYASTVGALPRVDTLHSRRLDDALAALDPVLGDAPLYREARRRASRAGHQRAHPCHRDFHPGNVVRDSAGSLRLVDLEDYGVDTPYVDIARMSFHPMVSDSVAESHATASAFARRLESGGFALEAPHERALADAVCYWAITSSHFFLATDPDPHPATNPDGEAVTEGEASARTAPAGPASSPHRRAAADRFRVLAAVLEADVGPLLTRLLGNQHGQEITGDRPE
jgi:hypothetical protein